MQRQERRDGVNFTKSIHRSLDVSKVVHRLAMLGDGSAVDVISLDHRFISG